MDLNEFQKAAYRYSEAGFAVLPINGVKRPALYSWKQFETIKPTTAQVNFWFGGNLPKMTGLAIIAGKVSGNLEVIDVDCKYDQSGSLMKDFCEILNEHLSELCPKLAIAKTVNGGFHIVYRVPVDLVQGNKKLASRPATGEEIANGKKKFDLIETRGEGGYFAAAPTNGYRWIRGSFEKLPVLTLAEREMIFTIARSFDQMPPVETVERKSQPSPSGELSPFEDYNARADVPALLERHGWRQVSRSGDRIIFQRPGKTENRFSANFHERLRVLYVFTTSTEFQSGRGYNPTQIYAQIEHNGDLSSASRKLYNDGFGARRVPKPSPEQKKPIERVPRKRQSSNFYLWFKERQKAGKKQS